MRYDPEFGQGRSQSRQQKYWQIIALLFVSQLVIAVLGVVLK